MVRPIIIKFINDSVISKIVAISFIKLCVKHEHVQVRRHWKHNLRHLFFHKANGYYNGPRVYQGMTESTIIRIILYIYCKSFNIL